MDPAGHPALLEGTGADGRATITRTGEDSAELVYSVPAWIAVDVYRLGELVNSFDPLDRVTFTSVPLECRLEGDSISSKTTRVDLRLEQVFEELGLGVDLLATSLGPALVPTSTGAAVSGTTTAKMSPSDDQDGDGVPDDEDNCPCRYNPDQKDEIEPFGTGDACQKEEGWIIPCSVPGAY